MVSPFVQQFHTNFLGVNIQRDDRTFYAIDCEEFAQNYAFIVSLY